MGERNLNSWTQTKAILHMGLRLTDLNGVERAKKDEPNKKMKKLFYLSQSSSITLPFSLFHSHSLSLSSTHTHTISLFLTHSLSHSLFFTITLFPPTLSLSLSLSFSLSHSFTNTHSISLSLTHSLSVFSSHSLSFSLFLSQNYQQHNPIFFLSPLTLLSVFYSPTVPVSFFPPCVSLFFLI